MNRPALCLLILFLSALPGARASQRFEVRGPYGGDVRSLAVHPQSPERFFLGTADGQIYISRNAGDWWEKLQPGLSRRNLVVDNLVFHPSNPSVLYAACWELSSSEGRLYVTRDAGDSWKTVDLGRFSDRIRAISIAPSEPQVLALGLSEGVILSTDEGRSWQRITRGYRSLHNVESLAFDPLDSQVLYVGTWRLGWKTIDRGKKWIPIHKGMHFDSDMFALLVNPSSPEVLYASACTGVYRSLNGGADWVKLRNGLPREAKRTRTLQFDPSDPRVVFAGTTVGLFRSTDGGDSWEQLLKGEVINAVSIHPADSNLILAAADDVGILRSRDGGASFAAANRGFVHRQIQALASHPRNPDALFAAVGSDRAHGGFFRTSDSGKAWERANEGLTGDDPVRGVRQILLSPGGEEIFMVLQDQIQRLTPNDTWQTVLEPGQLTIHEAAFAGLEGDLMVLATPAGAILLHLDTGKLAPATIPVYQGPVWAVTSTLSGSIFAGGNTGVFHSEDRGEHWTIKVSGLPPVAVRHLVHTPDVLLAATDQGLFLSRDEGKNWSARGLAAADLFTVAVSPRDPEWLVATDKTGIFLYESFDGGGNWTTHEPHRSSRIHHLAFTLDGRLWAGSLTEGVYLLHPRPLVSTLGVPRSSFLVPRSP